jgi:hypothetical protein
MHAGSLAKGDRPMDLLNVLKSLVSANQRLPKSACKPIMDGAATPGATIATVRFPRPNCTRMVSSSKRNIPYACGFGLFARG